MENYFNYFTEIEERFQRRRGGTLLLSTMDWALIETWKDAGIPLEAALRGIDSAFEGHEKRSSLRKVNSVAYCTQAVLAAAEEMKEAVVGVAREEGKSEAAPGLATSEIAAFFRRNADQLEAAILPSASGVSAAPLAKQTADTLRKLAAELESNSHPSALEDLERRLTVLEEKLFAVLLAVTPDEQIVSVRAQADRELAPYRRNMPAAQIEQLHKQYTNKKLLEKYRLPRLSLFYM